MGHVHLARKFTQIIVSVFPLKQVGRRLKEALGAAVQEVSDLLLGNAKVRMLLGAHETEEAAYVLRLGLQDLQLVLELLVQLFLKFGVEIGLFACLFQDGTLLLRGAWRGRLEALDLELLEGVVLEGD